METLLDVSDPQIYKTIRGLKVWKVTNWIRKTITNKIKLLRYVKELRIMTKEIKF